jgi:hypothetical protein
MPTEHVVYDSNHVYLKGPHFGYGINMFFFRVLILHLIVLNKS